MFSALSVKSGLLESGSGWSISWRCELPEILSEGSLELYGWFGEQLKHCMKCLVVPNSIAPHANMVKSESPEDTEGVHRRLSAPHKKKTAKATVILSPE